MEAPVLQAIIGPMLLGLLAVGGMLTIKILRRREATRAGTAGHELRIGETVSAQPLSSRDATRMVWRYFWSATTMIGASLLALVLMAPE